jgi:hypothetical protein
VVRNAEMIDAVSVAAYRKNGDVDFFFCLGCFMGCRKGFSDTNKKTNYITRLETVRRIY